MTPFSFDELDQIQAFPLINHQYVTARDGKKLAYYEFVPQKKATAVVVFYHGGGMYINKSYQYIGKELAENYGMVGCLVDIRGHGHSEGIRGDAPDKETVFSDIDVVLTLMRKKYGSLPIYLAGHSSGAGLLLNYNSWKIHTGAPESDLPTGYIFLAPFLGINAGTPRKHQDPRHNFVAWARTWVYIGNALSNGTLFKHIRSVGFNYSPEMLAANPLIVPSYTCAMSLATSPQNPKQQFSELSVPFALYIGSEDEQFLPEETIAYKHFAKDSIAQASLAEIVPGSKHLSIIVATASLINDAVNSFKEKLRS